MNLLSVLLLLSSHHVISSSVCIAGRVETYENRIRKAEQMKLLSVLLLLLGHLALQSLRVRCPVLFLVEDVRHDCALKTLFETEHKRSKTEVIGNIWYFPEMCRARLRGKPGSG